MALTDARHWVNFTHLRAFIAIGLLSSFISGCSPGGNSNERRIFPPFVKNQRKPDRPENSVLASGNPVGPILRSSERFKTKLVRSFDTSIVFKDNEGTGADRVMTRRCKRALERLAQLVRDEWENTVKLRVIEAWDEEGEHVSNSLHYEGRALDITTSDKDQGKYGRLATLAYHGARFDWVKYMDAHVHVSCREDGPEEEEQSHCFPANSLVRLENNELKRLADVAVGDKVLAVNQAGQVTYSEIIMFLDRQLDVKIENYVYIETREPTRRLSVTETHLLYVSKTLNDSWSLQYARDITIGDYLSVYIPGMQALIPAKIQFVQRKVLQGAIAPLTSVGNIVVSDVLSSCYAAIEDHSLAHLTFFPWRQIYKIAGQLMTHSKQTGMHWYVHILRTFNYLLGLYPNI